MTRVPGVLDIPISCQQELELDDPENYKKLEDIQIATYIHPALIGIPLIKYKANFPWLGYPNIANALNA